MTWRFHGNHILTGMFFKISIPVIKKIKKSILAAFFKSLDRFMVFLFVFITFEPNLDGFRMIWTNPEIQDGGPRWPPFRNDYAIITSRDVTALGCGRQRRHFQTYYLPSKSHCDSFYILRVTEGCGICPPPPPPPVVEDQKKPGLNRVNDVLTGLQWKVLYQRKTLLPGN